MDETEEKGGMERREREGGERQAIGGVQKRKKEGREEKERDRRAVLGGIVFGKFDHW